MRRLLLIMIIAFVVAVGVTWLADHPGHAVIDWQNWRLETSAVVLALILLGLTLVLLILFRILIWLFRDTPFAPERRRERRQRKGMEAVHLTLAALAAGRSRDAGRRAEEAVKFFGPTPLTLLLRAEAANLRHDDTMAHEALTALAEREDAGLMGYRGLAALALSRGDLGEARAALNAAENRDPDSAWVRSLGLTLAVREGRWANARTLLRDLRRFRTLPAAVMDRQEAALTQAQAIEDDLAGQGNDALAHAREALKLDPRLTPAAVLAARLADGAGRAGLRDTILKAAWTARPHPDLVRAALLGFENETATARLRRITELTAGVPDHVESRLARAEYAIAAEHWADARRDLDAAAATQPSNRVFTLLADLDEAESGESATHWREKAETTEGDAIWLCEACGSGRAHWSVKCPSCDALGSLDWKHPTELGTANLQPAAFSLLTPPQ